MKKTPLKTLLFCMLSFVILTGCGRETQRDISIPVEIQSETQGHYHKTVEEPVDKKPVDVGEFVKNVGLANSTVAIWNTKGSVIAYKKHPQEEEYTSLFFSTRDKVGYCNLNEVYVVADGKFYWKSNGSYIVGTYFNKGDYASVFSEYSTLSVPISLEQIVSVEQDGRDWVCLTKFEVENGLIAECTLRYSDEYLLKSSSISYKDEFGAYTCGEECVYEYGKEIPEKVLKFYNEMANPKEEREITYHVVDGEEKTENYVAKGPEGAYVGGIFSSSFGEEYSLYSDSNLTEEYECGFPNGNRDVYVLFAEEK